MFNQIIQLAKNQNKNILIIGSPRSGTHALGSELAELSQFKNIKEICKVSDNPEPWKEIQLLYNTDQLTIGQVVQFTPKIQLAKEVATIKAHAIIVNIRRRDKIKQFASWMYFRKLDPTEFRKWHNHTAEETNISPHSIQASQNDVLQFMLEQLIDDYFLPDFNLCYEELTFTRTKYQKNKFAYPLEEMFSNLEYIKQYLNEWHYCPDHFKNEK